MRKTRRGSDRSDVAMKRRDKGVFFKRASKNLMWEAGLLLNVRGKNIAISTLYSLFILRMIWEKGIQNLFLWGKKCIYNVTLLYAYSASRKQDYFVLNMEMILVETVFVFGDFMSLEIS
jgi:hypothetical protein